MDKQAKNIKKYPPGSEEAGKAGCTCPVLDNSYGKGYYGQGDKGIFVIIEGCPLHWKAELPKVSKNRKAGNKDGGSNL